MSSSAPEPPVIGGAPVTCKTMIEVDSDTTIVEGCTPAPAGGIGLLRIGHRTAFLDLIFDDLTSVERTITALQAVHRRMSARPAIGPTVLRAVPRG